MKVLDYKEVRTKLQGSVYVGELNVSYNKLVSIFGKPFEINSGDGKSRVNWVFLCGDSFFSIYDYKDSRDLEEVDRFSIGGTGPSGDFIKELTEIISLNV